MPTSLISTGVQYPDTSVQTRAFDFPTGTKMLFQQTSAPTGWTKVTTGIDNHALRVVTGTVGAAGANPFTASFNSSVDTSQAGGHTHPASSSTGQAGAHNHPVSVSVGNTSLTAGTTGVHSHTFNSVLQDIGIIPSPSPTSTRGDLNARDGYYSTAFRASTDVSMNNAGSGQAHAHPGSGSTGPHAGHVHPVSTTINPIGNHAHNFNQNVLYIDVIVATKD
jgi:hypothetical protein